MRVRADLELDHALLGEVERLAEVAAHLVDCDLATQRGEVGNEAVARARAESALRPGYTYDNPALQLFVTWPPNVRFAPNLTPNRPENYPGFGMILGKMNLDRNFKRNN